MRKTLAICMAAFAIFLLVPSVAARAELPKGKTIAVLVKGPSHAALARSILIRALLDEGYKAVDERQLERIRENKAAILALEGNVEAIMELGRTFSFSVLLSGSISLPQPVRNEFGLFTAMATVSATACTASNARQIAAGSASAKEIGYTADEAARKAVETATRSAAAALLGKAPPQSADTAGATFLVIAPARSFSEAHALAASCRDAGASSASVARFAGGRAEIDVSFSGSARQLLAALLGKRTDLREESVEGNTLRLSKE